jgi:hypothetical protein
MPSRPNMTPARYFLARFKVLLRPQFLLPMLGIAGILAFAWEFSQRPDWQQALMSREGTAPIADEEAKENDAIGADIDSLPLLSADFAKAKADLSTADAAAKQKVPDISKLLSKDGKNDPLSLNSIFGSGGNSNAAANAPGLLGDKGGLTGGGLASGVDFGMSRSNPLLASFGLGDRTSSTNPLNSALDRSNPLRTQVNPDAPFAVQPREAAPAVQPSPSPLPLAGNAPLNPTLPSDTSIPTAGTGVYNPSYPTAQPSVNSYTGLGNVPDTVSVPGFNPSAGVAAPAPLNPNLGVPVSPGSTPLPPGTVSAPVIQPEVPQELPFTAPRSIPGRPIGGGEINTFSNP